LFQENLPLLGRDAGQTAAACREERLAGFMPNRDELPRGGGGVSCPSRGPGSGRLPLRSCRVRTQRMLRSSAVPGTSTITRSISVGKIWTITAESDCIAGRRIATGRSAVCWGAAQTDAATTSKSVERRTRLIDRLLLRCAAARKTGPSDTSLGMVIRPHLYGSKALPDEHFLDRSLPGSPPDPLFRTPTATDLLRGKRTGATNRHYHEVRRRKRRSRKLRRDGLTSRTAPESLPDL
jgi:hypothetical protein